MRKIVSIFIVVLSAFGSEAADLGRYELDVNDFTELIVTEGINVDYKSVPDSAGKAVFYTTPDLASVMMFTNKKGKLELQLATDGVEYLNIPVVTVYSNRLDRVENSGDSTCRVLNVAPCPLFKAKVIGNGRIEVRDINATQVDANLTTGKGQLLLSGKCQTTKFGLTGGAGAIQAKGLRCQFSRCRIMGTGSISCYVTEELVISGGGTGTVYYKGNPPSVKKKISVGIKLESLDKQSDGSQQ